MSNMEAWIARYRNRTREWQADPELLVQIERGVMSRILQPQRSFRLGPVLAFAAAAVVILISTVSWPGDTPELLAEASLPAEVESVFYMKDHVAIWLDVAGENGLYPGGE